MAVHRALAKPAGMTHKKTRPTGALRLSGMAKTRLYVARTLDDAVAVLAERGRDGAPLAGATWIMRAALRHERHDLFYVAQTPSAGPFRNCH